MVNYLLLNYSEIIEKYTGQNGLILISQIFGDIPKSVRAKLDSIIMRNEIMFYYTTYVYVFLEEK